MLPLILLLGEVLAYDCDRVLVGTPMSSIYYPHVGHGMYYDAHPVSYLGALSLLMGAVPEQIREYHGACLQ